MATKPSGKRSVSSTISPAFISGIQARLRENRRVRRTLPGWGRIHIDRQLPFLSVYRRQHDFIDLDIQHLVTSEAAYLYTTADRRYHTGLAQLVSEVAGVMVEQFGAFLLLELWPNMFPEEIDDELQRATPRPRFRIISPPKQRMGHFLDKFVEALSRIRLGGQLAHVDVVSRYRIGPPKLRPLMTPQEAEQQRCLVLGLELLPVFIERETQELFPQLRRQMERSLAVALKRTFFEFARSRTTHRPPHFHALGRRATVRAVWRADRELSEVSDGFDFLLQVSPINGSAAWRDFQRQKYQHPPAFHYRPLPVDPVVLKRQLYETPVDRVEDPAIGQLLRDKVDELDREINMLLDINTPRFIHGSIQLYGDVEDSLFALAKEILGRLPKGTKTKHSDQLDALEFAACAREEIEYLRQQDTEVRATVEVRDDVNGLMVSHGSLLVGADTRIARDRVPALLQHEIGTHVLTYYNGKGQPFRQLYAGLSGYEALQEGIAVLSEYFVGGLCGNRLRLLAARVIAVRAVLDGVSFVECFQRLVDQYYFSPRVAFSTTMRVFRGGGLTKDAIYLRGLVQTLAYFSQGGGLEPLLIGKISVDHIPMMRELQWRQVLTEPRLRPRYLSDPEAVSRLDQLLSGVTVLDLLDHASVRKTRMK